MLLLMSGGPMRMLEWSLWPFLFINRYAPRAWAFAPHWPEWVTFVILCTGAFLHWYVWSFLLVFVWIRTSVHFKWVIGGYILAALATWAGFSHYSSRDDWTSRGLNPNRPGFQPAVVLLSGTFDYSFSDSSIGQHKTGSAYFEIRMHGEDYYYCKRWHGREWKVGSWYNVQLAMPGFCERRQLSRLGHTTRGGGGSCDPDGIFVARNLWRTNRFVGADESALIYERNGARQEFRNFFAFGPFSLPRIIVFAEGNMRQETYTVRKVEFLNSPKTNWFELIKGKHFDRIPQLRTAHLDEPGVEPGR
jgi:hypothetical protein